MYKLHRMQPKKSLLTVATGLLVVLLFCFSSAQAAQQLNAGTPPGNNDHPHNLSSTGASSIKSTETDQICVFCHTPHNSASDRGSLWNRPDITGSFKLYGEGSAVIVEPMIVSIPAAKYGSSYGDYPNGSTRLCLSCHDGVTAIGAVISSSDGPISLGPMTTMIIDLSTSHPVSFVYDSVVEGFLDDKGTAGSNLYKPAPVDILDNLSRVQCTTCHDPHSDTNEGLLSSYHLPMWRNWSGDEALDYDKTCEYCHNAGSVSGGIHPIP